MAKEYWHTQNNVEFLNTNYSTQKISPLLKKIQLFDNNLDIIIFFCTKVDVAYLINYGLFLFL